MYVCVLTALRESHIRLKSKNMSSETNERVNGDHKPNHADVCAAFRCSVA